MPRFNEIKNSFLAGELSPKVDGRTDLPQYKHGCSELTNMLVQAQGGATRRPGSLLRQAIDEKAKLIPFVFSKDETLVIWLSPSGWGCLQYVNSTWQGVRNGSWEGTQWDPNANVAFRPLRAVSNEDLSLAQYAQSGDTLYIVHPNLSPIRFLRVGSLPGPELPPNPLSMTAKIWETIPYRRQNTTTTTVTPSGLSGSITLTASASLFNTGHVNSSFKITHTGTPSRTGVAYITQYNSPTSVNALVLEPFCATTASKDWEEPEWSNSSGTPSGYGWPRTVAFFENRLVFGGNLAKPDTLWASQQSNYRNMMARSLVQDGHVVVAGDPTTAAPAAQEVNAIQWLSSATKLTIGTLGAEFTASDLAATEPTAIFKSESAYGSAYVKAVRVAHTTAYVRRDSKRVAEITYDFGTNANISKDLSLFGEHMHRKRSGAPSQIKEIHFQDSTGILWCVDSSGGLFAMTREREQEISAWHYHVLGGKLTVGGTDVPPKIHSAAVIPAAGGATDELWLIVERTLGGVNRFCIESLAPEFERDSLNSAVTSFTDAPVYLDCALVVMDHSPPITSITIPPDYVSLSGDTVSILADGVPQQDQVVAPDGTITFSAPVTRAIVGFPYTSRLKVKKADAGAVLGSALGAIQRIDRLVAKFFRTCGAKYGPSEAKLKSFNFRPSSLPQGDPIPPFTGEKDIEFHGDYDRDGCVVIESDGPLPMTVLSLTARGSTNEQ